MTDYIVSPNPEVKISSLDFEHLPLANFHIIAAIPGKGVVELR